MRTANRVEIQEDCSTCRWRLRRGSICNVSATTVRRLQQIATLRTYDVGAVLYAEEQIANGIFVLCNGRAKISISSGRGATMILKVAQPGEALGLEAVLANRRHEETAQLLDSCQVKFIPAEELHRLLADHGDAALKTAHQLNADCLSAREQIRLIGFSLTCSEKLARLLTTWVRPGRSGQPPETLLSASFTHREIARWSAARERRLLGR